MNVRDLAARHGVVLKGNAYPADVRSWMLVAGNWSTAFGCI